MIPRSSTSPKIQTYHSEAFARFIKQPSRRLRIDATLLESIRCLRYGSNMSHSDMHNNESLPVGGLGRGMDRSRAAAPAFSAGHAHAESASHVARSCRIPVDSMATALGVP